MMTPKLCVVVGVGSGLGIALAHRFGQAGYQVAMLARRADALAAYQAELSSAGITAQGWSVDVSDTPALINALAQIQQTLGTADVLIYNAAIMKAYDPLSISSEALIQDFQVTVAGALTAIQQVVPGMKAQGRGTILLTGGGLAYDDYSIPQYISLAIGKASIRKLNFVMANALEKDNIHVATVTICGGIQPNTHFAPEHIAEVYWQLHAQARSDWQREYVYR